MKISLLARFIPLFFFRGTGAILTFLSSILITRTLGVADSGNYFFVLTFVGVLLTFGSLGFNKVLVREFSKGYFGTGSEKKFILYRFFSCIALSCIILIIVYLNNNIIFDFFGFQNIQSMFFWMMISLPLLVSLSLLSHLLLAFRNNNTFIIINNLLFPFCLCLYLLFASSRLNIGAAYFTINLLLLFISVLTTLFIIKSKKIVVRHEPKNCINGWQNFLFTDVLNMLSISGAFLLVSSLLDSNDYSVLSVLYRLSSIFMLIIVTVNNVMLPNISNYHKDQNVAGMKKYVYSHIKFIAFILIISFSLMTLFANEILYLFGPYYEKFTFELTLMLIIIFVGALLGPCQSVMAMNGKENLALKFVFAGSFFGIILSYILTVNFGLLGSIVGVSIGIIIPKFLCFFWVWKYFNNVD